MRILMIGDVVGKPGRRAVQTALPGLRKEYDVSLVVANGENAAGGFGITLDTAQELLNSGVDVITSGNHIWNQKEIIPHLDGEIPILRPLNYPQGVAGKGYLQTKNALVVNLMGRVFIGNLDCPFRTMDMLLKDLYPRPKIIVVDFHAEATSEKGAMGWYLDGMVSAVVGTHTHVGTVDHRILPKGTAFVTDLGMAGPVDSVIGSNPQDVLARFLTQTPHRLTVAAGGAVRFNSVLLDVDEESGEAISIQRVDRIIP